MADVPVVADLDFPDKTRIQRWIEFGGVERMQQG
jgi:hypothetical protein